MTGAPLAEGSPEQPLCAAAAAGAAAGAAGSKVKNAAEDAVDMFEWDEIDDTYFRISTPAGSDSTTISSCARASSPSRSRRFSSVTSKMRQAT